MDVIGTYTNGVATHVDVITDHQAQKYSVYLNGALVAANKSFYDSGVPMGAHFSEFFVQQTAAEVGTNIVALDNLQYETDMPHSWITASGDWSTNGNWDVGVPRSGDTAYITNGGTATITSPAATFTLGA